MGTGGMIDYTQSPLSQLNVNVGGSGIGQGLRHRGATNFLLHGKYTTVVGEVGSIENIKSPLWLTNGIGPSKVVLDGLFSPAAKTVTINNDTITGLRPRRSRCRAIPRRRSPPA